MQFITIHVFQFPTEAQIAKSFLESENIEVFLKDELTVQSHNFISNAVGGVKLQVKEDDIITAKRLLAEKGYLRDKIPQKDSPIINTISKFSFTQIVLVLAIILLAIGFSISKLSPPTKPNKIAKENHPVNDQLNWDTYDSYIVKINKEPSIAITQLKELTEEKPFCPDCFELLGKAFVAINSTQQAITSYEKQMSISGHHPRGFNNIANAYWAAEDYANSAKFFKKSAEINEVYNYELGCAYNAYNDTLNAIKAFETYLNLKYNKPHKDDSIRIANFLKTLKKE